MHDIKKLLESSGVKLLPPLGETALMEFERSLPGPLPSEIRELLRFTKAFELKQDFDCEFVAFDGDGARDMWSSDHVGLPNALPISPDGAGNCWAVDIHSDGTWNDVFYLSHDPPWVVRQYQSLNHFVQALIEMDANPKAAEEWPDSDIITGKGISQSEALMSAEAKLREFAETLPSDFHIFDLRSGSAINTFEWYLDSEVRRLGEENIFAVQDPKPRKGFWAAVGLLFGSK